MKKTRQAATTCHTFLRWATDCLARSIVKPTATLDSAALLSFVAKRDRGWLLAHPEHPLTTRQRAEFRRLVRRRATGVPLAYLTGAKEFYGRSFAVSRATLVPRPDTECLIDAVREQLPPTTTSTIADIGTGSGCIAITLKKLFPRATVFGTDVSAAALAVARQNARRHQVHIHWQRGHLLAPLRSQPIDALVANLPYGHRGWPNTTATTVGLRFEPPRSLFTGERGLALYRQLFEQIQRRTQQPRLILCEYDPRQTSLLRPLVARLLPEYNLKIQKDLAGHDRVAILTHRG